MHFTWVLMYLARGFNASLWRRENRIKWSSESRAYMGRMRNNSLEIRMRAPIVALNNIILPGNLYFTPKVLLPLKTLISSK